MALLTTPVGTPLLDLEGMSATGVDQSTESTEKAQAHPKGALITHMSRTPEFSGLLLRCTMFVQVFETFSALHDF